MKISSLAQAFGKASGQYRLCNNTRQTHKGARRIPVREKAPGMMIRVPPEKDSLQGWRTVEASGKKFE